MVGTYKFKMNEDTELLILTIEKFESIWNKNNKDYQNKTLKDASWQTVCETVFDDWGTLSAKEKNTRLYDVKKRWHNIRDYYKKEIDQQRAYENGNGTKKRRGYVYGDILEYLRPIFENRAPTIVERKIKERRHKTRPKHHSTSTTVLEKRPEISVPEIQQENDSDLLFLKSLLPDMKSLTDNQKCDFKIGIMQLYRNIKQGTLHSSTATSCTQNSKEKYRYVHVMPKSQRPESPASESQSPGPCVDPFSPGSASSNNDGEMDEPGLNDMTDVLIHLKKEVE